MSRAVAATVDKLPAPQCADRRRPVIPRFRCLRFLDGDEGASIIEGVLALLVFIPLLFGAIEFSYAFYTCHDVCDAARRASRWAAVRGSLSCTNIPGFHTASGFFPYTCRSGATSSDIQSFVQALGYPDIASSSLKATTTWLSASASTPTSGTACAKQCNASGNEVQVTVTHPFKIGIPYWKVATINFNSTSAMVIAE